MDPALDTADELERSPATLGDVLYRNLSRAPVSEAEWAALAQSVAAGDLDGELWIDDRKLFAGDYNRAEAGTGDKRVWSETGCTCVLVTSTRDVLGP